MQVQSPRTVGLALDPDFHAGATTRNRFQYLADRMAAFEKPVFDPIGIVGATSGKTYVLVAALINQTVDAMRLSGLQGTTTASPPSNVLATGSFYVSADTSLVLPAHSIYFVRLHLVQRNARPSSATSVTYDFHYGRLLDCGVACAS